MSFYLVAFQGGMGLGSAFHGWLAGRIGIPNTLIFASLVVLSGIALIKSLPLAGSDHLVMTDTEEAA